MGILCKAAEVGSATTELKMGRSLVFQNRMYKKLQIRQVLPWVRYTVKKAPAYETEREIGFDDFSYAMQNETKELTDADKDLLLSMARQLNAARRQKDEKSK